MTLEGGGPRRFATTRWSLVLRAGADASVPGSDEALASLCEAYWYPLYAYLRSHGSSVEEAQDMTQAFFARVLEKKSIRHADPARGRFRSFLLASLKNFAANERERDLAAKRGGGISTLSLEVEGAEGRFQLEPPSDETPETIFDRRWAVTLLDRALARLKGEMVHSGKDQQFERLKPYLVGDQPQLSYADTGSTLGMSEGAVKVAVHRLRRQFRDLVRDEIAQTVSSPEEVDDELRHLWSAVRR
jgi:RNA polymerase sigma-70 factor (ECF subfamily)